MKNVFRIIRMMGLVVALAFAGTAPATAQPASKGPRMGSYSESGRGFDALILKLDLSDDQSTQVRAALLEHRAEGRAWMQSNPNATREERLAFMNEHRETLTVTLSEMLSSEQQETLQEWFASGRNAFGSRGDRRGTMRGNRSGLMSQRLIDRLDLTDEQQQELRALRSGLRAEMMAWQDANPDATREEMRAYRLEHWQEAQSTIESVLTEDQLVALRAMKDSRRDRFDQRRGGSGGGRGDLGPRSRNMN